jgi:hypothetical protein
VNRDVLLLEESCEIVVKSSLKLRYSSPRIPLVLEFPLGKVFGDFWGDFFGIFFGAYLQIQLLSFYRTIELSVSFSSKFCIFVFS